MRSNQKIRRERSQKKERERQRQEEWESDFHEYLATTGGGVA